MRLVKEKRSEKSEPLPRRYKIASLAKLTQPSAAGSFTRHRLFQLIGKKLSNPVLWITGPPGSGKTTLVSSYVAAHGFLCL